MSRQMGRISTPAVQNDLIYDVAPSAARTPSVNLRRQPPRQPPARKPRTWEDIPRTQADVDTEAADKIKYSRSPTPLLSKGLSRNDEWLGVRSPLKDTYEHTMASPDNDGTLLGKSADAVFRSSTGTRSCSVDLSRSKRNFSKETPALDLVYDVDHSGVEKHVPAAVIKKDIFTKPSSLSANASPELGAYSVDLLHSKVVHNVSLAGMSSRQQQSKSGRTSPAPLTEAQHKFYDTHKDHAPLPSSPKIALGLSREQRAKVIHAAKPFVDVIYDYSVETGKKSASGKGNLDFGRALDREHRGPSRADL
jgi:hypothetical protein